MSRKKLFLIIGICLFTGMFVFIVNRHVERSKASGEENMIDEINNMALPAQSGQQTAVTDLVDTIFEQNSLDQLNPVLVASLKDRIVRAELNGQTVAETQVMQAFNWLAAQYSAPDYAKTSSMQIRSMRINLSAVIPNLFVDKDSQGRIGVNKLLNSEPSTNMPPTQAVTLMIMMVHQKVLNQYFQKPPAQWDADFVADLESGNLSQQSSGGGSGFSARIASQETEQMHQLVYGTPFSLTDQERIGHGVLDQLGIPR